MDDLNQAVWQKLIEPIAAQVRGKATALDKLVHYTSFGALKSIVENREIWFSSADTMNDFQELRHGKAVVQEVAHLADSTIRNIFQTLKDRYPSHFQDVDDIFKRKFVNDPYDSFISCWSQANIDNQSHDDLTMWRSYAADGNGVAIVIDPATMQLGSTDMSDIVFWPVYYESDADLVARSERAFDQFANILDGLTEREKGAPPRLFAEAFNELLYFLTASHKHHAFAPEREWRFIWRRDDRSAEYYQHLKPQMGPNGLYEYFCLPIKDDPNLTKGKLNLPDIVVEVMIGPTNDKPHKHLAVRNLLARNGFDLNKTAVTVSAVPYRSKS